MDSDAMFRRGTEILTVLMDTYNSDSPPERNFVEAALGGTVPVEQALYDLTCALTAYQLVVNEYEKQTGRLGIDVVRELAALMKTKE